MIGPFRALRRRLAERRIGGSLVIGVSILLFVVLFSLIGSFLVDARKANVGAVPPRRPPSAAYVLGTDSQGRDMLATLVLGTPKTLKMDPGKRKGRSDAIHPTPTATRSTTTMGVPPRGPWFHGRAGGCQQITTTRPHQP